MITIATPDKLEASAADTALSSPVELEQVPGEPVGPDQVVSGCPVPPLSPARWVAEPTPELLVAVSQFERDLEAVIGRGSGLHHIRRHAAELAARLAAWAESV